MTRHGKIARLPYEIREQLNNRLLDGEPARRLVKWLNTLPEVKEALEEDFGGRPLTEQNLSEWKKGGFEDWRRQRDVFAWAQSLRESANELQDATEGAPLVELLATPLAVALGKLLDATMKNPDDPGHCERLLAVAEQITKLFRGTQAAEQARIQREKWETEQEKEMEKKRIFAKSMAEARSILKAGGSLKDLENWAFNLDDDEEDNEEKEDHGLPRMSPAMRADFEESDRLHREYEAGKNTGPKPMNGGGDSEKIQVNPTKSK